MISPKTSVLIYFYSQMIQLCLLILMMRLKLPTTLIAIWLPSINGQNNSWFHFAHLKQNLCLSHQKKRKDPPPPITFGPSVIKEVTAHKHLSVIFSNNLSWSSHIEYCIHLAGRRVDILAHLMFRLDRNTLEIILKSFIQPILEYGDILMPLLNRSIKGLEVWLVVLLGEPV